MPFNRTPRTKLQNGTYRISLSRLIRYHTVFKYVSMIITGICSLREIHTATFQVRTLTPTCFSYSNYYI